MGDDQTIPPSPRLKRQQQVRYDAHYPSRCVTVPAVLTPAGVCTQYPNHLHDEMLLWVTQFLTDREIAEHLPETYRNRRPGYRLNFELRWLRRRREKALARLRSGAVNKATPGKKTAPRKAPRRSTATDGQQINPEKRILKFQGEDKRVEGPIYKREQWEHPPIQEYQESARAEDMEGILPPNQQRRLLPSLGYMPPGIPPQAFLTEIHREETRFVSDFPDVASSSGLSLNNFEQIMGTQLEDSLPPTCQEQITDLDFVGSWTADYFVPDTSIFQDDKLANDTLPRLDQFLYHLGPVMQDVDDLFPPSLHWGPT